MDQFSTQGRAAISVLKASSFTLGVLFLGGCLPAQTPAGPSVADAAPTFTSARSVDVSEGATTGFYTATANTLSTVPLTFSISGGVDGPMLAIDATSGELSFNIPPNFESPADSDGNGEYQIELRVEDVAGRSSTQSLDIQVTDVNEAPVFSSNAFAGVAENTVGRYVATATDPDQDAVTFSISGGDDSALFSIDPVRGSLRFTTAPDFDAPIDTNADNRYDVEITADDGNGLSASMNVEVTVTDVSRLQLDVSFPTPSANLGGVADTVVTGSLVDLEDDLVEFDDVAFIDVNGQVATQDIDDVSRWSVQVSVNRPQDQLLLRTESTDQNVHSMDLSVQNETVLVFPDLIAIGSDPDQLLIGDGGGLGSVLSMHLPSGALTTVVAMGVGSGPEIVFPDAAIFDVSSDRALVLDSTQRALFSIDLSSGNRTIISADGIGSGPMFDDPASLALDTSNNRVLVVDANLAALVAVDLISGSRVVISDAAIGNGPDLLLPTTVALDEQNNRALVGDIFFGEIISIDLTSGNRSILADASTGAGISYPLAMSLDETASNLLVLDIDNESLVSIDTTSGVGTLISDSTTGTGPVFTTPIAMALDARRERALLVDLALNQILAVDLVSGDRTPFAVSRTGSGPSLAAATKLALDATDNSVLVAHTQAGQGGLIRVDLDTGNRNTLSDENTGTGPLLDGLSGLAIDNQNRRALVTDDMLDAVLSVDMSNGDRTVVSGSGVGSGTALSDPTALVHDIANNRVLVTDGALDALLSINISSGDRTVVSAPGIGSGPLVASPTAIALDTNNARALVLDADLNALIAIDLLSGDRSVIADQNVGLGPVVDNPVSIALDLDNNRALLVDGETPATLYWVDLATGDRIVASDFTQSGPALLTVSSIDYDAENEVVFATDIDTESLVIVEANSGQRAIVSR